MDQGNNTSQTVASAAPASLPAEGNSDSLKSPTAQQATSQDPTKNQVNPEEEIIGSADKEAGPVVSGDKQEIIRSSESEPVLTAELQEAGVAVVADKDEINVDPVLKAHGVMPVKTAVKPVDINPTDKIDEVKAIEIRKTHHFIDSVYWLATLIIEEAKKIHRKIQ